MELDDDALGIVDEDAPAAPRRSFPWFRGLILSGIMVAGLVDLETQLTVLKDRVRQVRPDAGITTGLTAFPWLGNDRWYDRGPGGGTISYDTRVERFSLGVNPATGAISNIALAVNTGAVKAGIPNQAALAMPARSTGLPRPRPLVSTA